MQSRKDQVQAYFFVVGRLVSALTHGKPDIVEAPDRRFTTAGTFGVLLAALLAAIFWVVGIYLPTTSTSWQAAGSLIIDKDTGARYVYLDGQLRPVLNYSSARLILGGPGTVQQVSAQSLAGVRVGQPIGIPGAPDSLPDPAGLDSGAWTVCLGAADNGSGPAPVTLLLSAAPPAGSDVDERQGLLVSGPDGTNYLLWHGLRYRVTSPAVLNALGYGSTAPLPAPANWLNPIPAGRDLGFPAIAGSGGAGPSINGQPSLIGQLYAVDNPALGAAAVYVVRQDGLTRLDQATEALLLAAPDTRKAYPDGNVRVVTVPPGTPATTPMSASTDLVTGYPSPLPTLVNPSLSAATSPCVRFTPGPNGQAPATAFTTMPAAAVASRAMTAPPHPEQATVDRVVIPQGTGVLVQTQPAPGAAPGAEYLVTDLGVKFPLPGQHDQSSAQILGYGQTSPVELPGQLLALLPTGPTLDPTDALLPHSS